MLNFLSDSLEMLLLLLWRHVDYYINGADAENDGARDEHPSQGTHPTIDPDLSQTARPTLNESKSGWGISLFSPFRRKADSPAPANNSGNIGVPLASSTFGTGQANSGLGRSVLTVSALGGGRRYGGVPNEGREAEVFRVNVGHVLEPIFERLGSLQLVSLFIS